MCLQHISANLVFLKIQAYCTESISQFVFGVYLFIYFSALPNSDYFPCVKKKHIKKSDHPFISDTKYKPYLGFLKQTKLTKVVLNCNSSHYCVKLSTVQIKKTHHVSVGKYNQKHGETNIHVHCVLNDQWNPSGKVDKTIFL